MDGFHYYKSELDTYANADHMHLRRGAHFTFNAESFYHKLNHLKQGYELNFPTFSHTIGDPEEDKINIDPEVVKIVLIEGLYLYCDLPV